MYKIYFTGNVMMAVNVESGKVYEAPKKDCKVRKTSSTTYDINVGSTLLKIAFADIQDANGSAYADAATFETLYRANTGDVLEVAIDDTREFTNAITVPDVTVSNQTASRIASIDGSKKVISLDTATYPSLAELAHVKGAIQRVDPEIVAKTNDYTMTLAEAGDIVTLNKSTAATITIPLNASVAYPIGTRLKWVNIGAGTWTIAITDTGTLLSAGSKVAVVTGGTVEAVKIGTNTWALTGDLS